MPYESFCLNIVIAVTKHPALPAILTATSGDPPFIHSPKNIPTKAAPPQINARIPASAADIPEFPKWFTITNCTDF
jgi:hypothetical protein